MARMKVFFKYLIILLVVYVLVDFFTYRYLVNSYKNIKTYEIIQDSPDVTIKEAKATAVNGYIVADVKNTTGENIDMINLKIDLYNSRGNNIGTKYVKLENFNADETKEIRANFRASNVAHFKVSFIYEDVDAQIQQDSKELQETSNKWIPFVGLVTLICMT